MFPSTIPFSSSQDDPSGCDAALTASRTSFVPHRFTLYFRGRGLFDGLFDELLTNRGLDKATELLYAGCSAGGLTTYIHADAVAATMKTRAPGATVVALADAMFSLNHLDFKQVITPQATHLVFSLVHEGVMC